MHNDINVWKKLLQAVKRRDITEAASLNINLLIFNTPVQVYRALNTERLREQYAKKDHNSRTSNTTTPITNTMSILKSNVLNNNKDNLKQSLESKVISETLISSINKTKDNTQTISKTSVAGKSISDTHIAPNETSVKNLNIFKNSTSENLTTVIGDDLTTLNKSESNFADIFKLNPLQTIRVMDGVGFLQTSAHQIVNRNTSLILSTCGALLVGASLGIGALSVPAALAVSLSIAGSALGFASTSSRYVAKASMRHVQELNLLPIGHNNLWPENEHIYTAHNSALVDWKHVEESTNEIRLEIITDSFVSHLRLKTAPETTDKSVPAISDIFRSGLVKFIETSILTATPVGRAEYANNVKGIQPTIEYNESSKPLFEISAEITKKLNKLKQKQKNFEDKSRDNNNHEHESWERKKSIITTNTGYEDMTSKILCSEIIKEEFNSNNNVSKKTDLNKVINLSQDSKTKKSTGGYNGHNKNDYLNELEKSGKMMSTFNESISNSTNIILDTSTANSNNIINNNTLTNLDIIKNKEAHGESISENVTLTNGYLTLPMHASEFVSSKPLPDIFSALMRSEKIIIDEKTRFFDSENESKIFQPLTFSDIENLLNSEKSIGHPHIGIKRIKQLSTLSMISIILTVSIILTGPSIIYFILKDTLMARSSQTQEALNFYNDHILKYDEKK